MAYDEALAARVRDLLGDEPAVAEKRMFGGLAFLVGGHLAVGVSGQGGLMVRCAPGDTDALLGEPEARPFEMRGRALSGWLRVVDDGIDDPALERWVAVGLAHARSLPPK